MVGRIFIAAALLGLYGCASNTPRVGDELKRRGDEIVVAGRYFHTGAPVVLWTDPGGYDAYRTERRFSKWEDASWEATTRSSKDGPNSPNRLGLRAGVLTNEEIELVRGGGWPLELLQEKVDQFVIHYDVCGTSRQCFKVLHDLRGLSVQFMLDIDGTIYQTMDVKERAWHATRSNTRSVGIEIANMGAYKSLAPIQEWYSRDETGRTRITIPARFGDGGVRTPGFIGRPVRDEPVKGVIQGTEYLQYDLTPQQYDSLIKLTAALCTALPKIQCDYPRDSEGRLIPHVLTDEEWENFQGLIGHFHVQKEKQDPGPAFQWDYVVTEARKLMSPQAIARMEAMKGKPVRNVQPPATRPVTVRPTPPALAMGESRREPDRAGR
jgi:N-acetyl-anhydromuramyl-L-alanine amidase AmpD